jgi:hypothetical protein
MTAAPNGNQVSPWLEMTRWPKYLEWYPLAAVAKLPDLPDLDSEPALDAICESFDRIIEAGHRSVYEDRINVFDLV